jgi:hypothetical protein
VASKGDIWHEIDGCLACDVEYLCDIELASDIEVVLVELITHARVCHRGWVIVVL